MRSAIGSSLSNSGVSGASPKIALSEFICRQAAFLLARMPHDYKRMRGRCGIRPLARTNGGVDGTVQPAPRPGVQVKHEAAAGRDQPEIRNVRMAVNDVAVVCSVQAVRFLDIESHTSSKRRGRVGTLRERQCESHRAVGGGQLLQREHPQLANGRFSFISTDALDQPLRDLSERSVEM